MEIQHAEFAAVEQIAKMEEAKKLRELLECQLIFTGGGTAEVSFE